MCTSGDQLLAKATYSLAHSQGRLARGGTERSVSRGSCGAALRTPGRHDSLSPSLLSSILFLFFLLASLSPLFHYHRLLLNIIAPDTFVTPLRKSRLVLMIRRSMQWKKHNVNIEIIMLFHLVILLLLLSLLTCNLLLLRKQLGERMDGEKAGS